MVAFADVDGGHGASLYWVRCASIVVAENLTSNFFISISLGLNVRELLVHKNCTSNCTFLYPSEVPPEAPRVLKTNSFYFVRCCNGMVCNEGGPTNFERDILPEYTIEEELEGTVRLGESTFFLSVASLLVSNTLT